MARPDKPKKDKKFPFAKSGSGDKGKKRPRY
jgi:hypothetical protein